MSEDVRYSRFYKLTGTTPSQAIMVRRTGEKIGTVWPDQDGDGWVWSAVRNGRIRIGTGKTRGEAVKAAVEYSGLSLEVAP
jgi:hypothetical protein